MLRGFSEEGVWGLPVVSFKVIPVVGESSVSRYVAEAVRVLREEGFDPIVTPDTTVVVMGDLARLGVVLERIHGRLREMGVGRVVTIVMVDDRFDRRVRDPGEMVESVLRRLGGG